MSLRLVEVIVADRQTEAARALLGPYCARVWQAAILAVWLVVLALFAAMIVGRIALGISWSG